METPILFIVFNRLDTVKKVFEQIKNIKPKKLYISADGARDNIENEKENCENVKNYIINSIDWECEVKTLFHKKNLGCKLAPATAINWLFENEEYGIILEDDCLFSNSFIILCESLLKKYKDDERIMMISGNNFQNGLIRGDGSYYFQRIPHCWGWATWRRAWKLFDIEIKTFPKFYEQNKIAEIFENSSIQWYWTKVFTRVYKKNITTAWDYQWAYTIMSNHGLSIVPNKNLVKNIGISTNSTHTNFNDIKSYSIETEELEEIIPPTFILPDKEAEEYEHKNHFKINISKPKAILRKIFYKKLKIE